MDAGLHVIRIVWRKRARVGVGMNSRKHLALLVILVVALLVAPLAVEAKRPVGVGRPTVTIVPPIPLLPGPPVPGVPPEPRSTPSPATREEPVLDPQATWLGPITVLSNRTGFHLWYTPVESRDGYMEGRQYHATFKVRTKCTPGWSAITVPDRAPYNLTPFVGRQMCYRVSGLSTGAADREAMAR